jgi:hypothetical protein
VAVATNARGVEKMNDVLRTTIKWGVPVAGILALSVGIARQDVVTDSEWQAFALADLKAVRNLVQSSHPGYIDQENPDFRRWNEEGYAKALKHIPSVNDYNSAMAAVRFYTVGFRDAHFTYSDNARKPDDAIHSNGTGIELVNGRYIVAGTLAQWPVKQPPIGAELLSCDGLSPTQIIAERLAPYYNLRKSEVNDRFLANLLHTRWFARDEVQHCKYRAPDGVEIGVDVQYKGFSAKDYFLKIKPVLFPKTAGQSETRTNGYVLNDGVLWITASNFNLRPGSYEAGELKKMLNALPGLTGVKKIIFDTRGNQGGDSRVGWRIFEAATGGLDYDKQSIDSLPHTFAEWRVSDLSLSTAASTTERMSNIYGRDSKETRSAAEMHRRLVAARDAGAPWLRQDAGYRITAKDIAARGGRLRRFDGKVALITDARCASACLDFADIVKSVPGSVHLGRPTSSDTLYIDSGVATLPSGNLLFMPLKVWRNRLRGSGEFLQPDVELASDLDEKSFTRAVLAALDR